MILWKREAQRQKISQRLFGMTPKSGQAEWVVGMFFILFGGILLSVQLQVKAYKAASLYIEDALAASNLASAVIDIQEYGTSHQVVIADADTAYQKYCVALQENLQLNEQWEGQNKALISGEVVVENYTVYNVVENTVKVMRLGENGVAQAGEECVGSCIAPNGVPVVATSVYSEISFPVKGIFGMQVTAHKGKLVDIVAERME